jgi:hypothetical protein
MTPTDWIQAISTFILVGVTGFYAWRTNSLSKATEKQAQASVEMAEEMREQRRPIVVQKVVPAGYETQPFDYFEIYNLGVSPAIELEIFLLDTNKKLLSYKKETFFPQNSDSIEVVPNGLNEQVGNECYILCQYRGVVCESPNNMWYQTWLPFTPKKAQSGDNIILTVKQIEFCETNEKRDF